MAAKPSSLSKELVSQRFQAGLNRFMAHHSVVVSQLAGLIPVPVSTLYTWLNGTRLPCRARMQQVCRRLKLDYAPMRDSSALLEGMFLSFEAVNRLYRRVRAANPEHSRPAVALAAAILFNRIILSGLLVDLRITRTHHCCLTLLHPPLDGLALEVEGTAKGIVASILDETGERVEGCTWPLTDEQVPQLIERLKSFEAVKSPAVEVPAPAAKNRRTRRWRWRRKPWNLAATIPGSGGANGWVGQDRE